MERERYRSEDWGYFVIGVKHFRIVKKYCQNISEIKYLDSDKKTITYLVTGVKGNSEEITISVLDFSEDRHLQKEIKGGIGMKKIVVYNDFLKKATREQLIEIMKLSEMYYLPINIREKDKGIYVEFDSPYDKKIEKESSTFLKQIQDIVNMSN